MPTAKRLSALALSSAVLTIAVVPALILAPAETFGQYIYLDSNGDGVHGPGDVLAPNGVTTFDVWLQTDHGRDGAMAACGAAEMSLVGYQIVLRAQNGTVTWTPLVNARPEFPTDYGSAMTATELAGGFTGSSLPQGLYRLASFTAAPATGTPAIVFAESSSLSSMFLTSFVSACPGADMDNTLKLGVDWSDADGAAYGGTANQTPTLAPISNVALDEGSIVDQPLHATDPDGDPVTFSLASGPAYVAVTTTDPGAGNASGLAHIAPGYSDAGAADVTLVASDDFSAATTTFQITVRDVNRPPVFLQPEDIMAAEGYVSGEPLEADDPDGDRVAFSLVSGPSYVTVTTFVSELGRTSGSVTVAPGYTDAGMVMVTVGASDGTNFVTREFSVMVRDVNRTPSLLAPPVIDGAEGEPLGFVAQATDPDGQMVELDAAPLPEGASFTDRMDNTGIFQWTPRYDQAGPCEMTITADDHAGPATSRTVSITVTDVTAPVALAQPDSMALYEGESREEALHAYDGDGSPLTFSLGSGPAWATVATTDPGTGLAAGLLRVAPGFGDAGLVSLLVTASDGVNHADRLVPVMVMEAGSAPGETPFSPPFITLGTGSTPHTVTMGDVDRDGRMDLGVSNLGANSVSIYLGHGDGTFEMRMDYPTAARPHTLIIRDVNGDGVPDLTLSEIAANSIATLLGRRDGTFGPRTDFAMPGSPVFVGLADFDGDGILDAVSTNQTTGAVTSFRGAGDGTFAARGEFATGDHAHGLAIGDVNGDGRPDAVSANGGGTVSTLLGRGDGSFDAKRDLTTSAPHTVNLGDLDGDGRLDMVVVNFDTGSVTILRGHGDGTFTVLEEIATGKDAHGAAIGDVDQDGIPDVVVANQGASTVSFLMGRGGGTFAPKLDFAVGTGAHSVAIGDVNGDGAPDVAVSSIVANTVTLLLNRRPPPRAGRAFAAEPDDPLRLRSAKPLVTFYVEPLAGEFDAAEIDLASCELASTGTGSISRIPAVLSKGALTGDKDRNGVSEASLSFTRDDLRALFSGIVGRRTVHVMVEGRLIDDARFRAPLILTVIGTEPPRHLSVLPNPLRSLPSAVTFSVDRRGPVTARVFDVRGNEVRTLLNRVDFAPGRARVEVPGTDNAGRPLASGVYFVRVEAPGSGMALGRFVIVR